MVLKFNTSYQAYDDKTGKVDRDLTLSIHADCDEISKDFITEAIASFAGSVGLLIADSCNRHNNGGEKV